MVSTSDYRKTLRLEHKSTVMLSDEHSEYFSYAQLLISERSLGSEKSSDE
jgi:hypothetical protein